MILKTIRKERGFSLIEVMVAALVLSIGILAISKLQGTLIKGGSLGHERSIAATLASRKIDDLRYPNTSDYITYFTTINTNQGGAIPSGSSTLGNTEYELSWTVSTFEYPSLDAAPITTTYTDIGADFKQVAVTVSWIDATGAAQSLVINSVIDNDNPAFASAAIAGTTTLASPNAVYETQNAPDVIPIDLNNDLRKETSKPEPEVSKDEYATIVDFETVTYTTSGTLSVKREDFRTVACTCNDNGTTTDTQHIYGYTTWDKTEETLVDLTTVTTNTRFDTQNGSALKQRTECDICCKDGRYDPDNGIDDANFTRTGGSPGGSIIDDGNVNKICRLKRVDGVLRVFKPWKLIGFNLIPASYFDDSRISPTTQLLNISTYSNYVTSLVRYALDNYSAITASPNTSFHNFTDSDGRDVNEFINGSVSHKAISYQTTSQLQARAVYLDSPPSGIYLNQTSTNYTAANVPLDRIPFYEVNLTKLAGWVPDENNATFLTPYTAHHDSIPSGADKSACKSAGSTDCVSNQELVDKTETVYSRGLIYKEGATDTTVTSRIYTSDDGITNKSINSNTSVDSSAVITTK